MMKLRNLSVPVLLVAGALLVVLLLRKEQPVSEGRFVQPDKLFQMLEADVRSEAEFEVIVDIDHARLAAKAGSVMPPSHVLVWSDPELESAILKHNPVAAVDLPLRALAFEERQTGRAAVIANSYDYVAQRHSLPDNETLRGCYEMDVAKAMRGIPEDAIVRFSSDTMPDAGLVTLNSLHGFADTEERILKAINAQSDTVSFGSVDFAERAKKRGVTLQPVRLILFGGPGPGGKAMASAPTLGLDAFCQKLLVWQDTGGTVHVTFNDLMALAERQQVSGGIPLRVINRRLKQTFSAALTESLQTLVEP